MKYLNFLKERNITTFPIKITFKEDKSIKLSNDEYKQKKILGKTVWSNKFNMYICPDMNDLNDIELCNKRWEEYNNGNPKGYNAYAVDTWQIGVIDIDCDINNLFKCVNGQRNPLLTLEDMLPYKKSNTKSFGRHLIFDRKDIPKGQKRCTNKLPLDLGFTLNKNKEKKDGIEFLNGQWQWVMMDDVINYPERCMNIPESVFDVQYEIERFKTPKKTPKKTTTKKKKTKTKAKAKATKKKLTEKELEKLRERLLNIPEKTMSSVTKCAGVIRACAASEDERVFKIILEVCKRPGSNFEDEDWVRAKWNSYKGEDKYKNKFYNDYLGLSEEEELELENIKSYFDYFDEWLENIFMRDFKKSFRHNTIIKDTSRSKRAICYCDKNNLWHVGDGAAEGKIFNILTTEIKILFHNNFEKMIDDNHDIIKTEKDLLNTLKSQFRTIYKKFSTCSWIKGKVSLLYNSLYFDESIKEDIIFNSSKEMLDYFQFKNGAFNLKTGKLEKRTREMYISETLDYDYYDVCDEELKQEILTIHKQILPEEEFLEGFLRWRGYCLTGQTCEQKFVINVGQTAANGKSTLAKMYAKAFPIYAVKMLSKAFDEGKDTDYNKNFSSFVHKSYRLGYMEEFGRKQLDPEVLKATVEGDSISVRPLYSEMIQLQIQAKIEASSNFDPNLGRVDKGLNRRGRIFKFSSKFIDNEKDFKKCRMKNKFMITPRHKNMEYLHDDMGKLTLFHIYKEYAKKYYDEGLILPKKCKDAFEQAAMDCDVIGDWVRTNFFFSDNEKHRLHKKEIKEMINKYKDDLEEEDKKTFTLKNVMTAMKSEGFSYKRSLRHDGERGCFVGITNYVKF